MAEPESWQISTNPVEFAQAHFVPAPSARWAGPLAEAASIAPGDRVLSVGCGTRIVPPEISDRVAPGGEVTGLDIAEGGAVAARDRTPEPSWRHRERPSLPFDDATFDAVVSQFALTYVPNPAAVLAEMLRVLAPGGRLAAGEWGPVAEVPVYAKLATAAAARLGEDAARALTAPFGLGNEESFRALCRSAGLVEPRIELSEGEVAFESANAFVEMEILGSPLASMASDTELHALTADIAGRLAEHVAADGRLVFPLRARILTAVKG